jgi:hypothetical protein
VGEKPELASLETKNTPANFAASNPPILLTDTCNAQQCHAFRQAYAIALTLSRVRRIRDNNILASGTDHSVLARIYFA